MFTVLLALIFGSGLLPAAWQTAWATSGKPVISQIFGGGGNSGAPFKNDFVELFNPGPAPVSLAGWSLQYASATGTGNFASNTIVPLSGLLAPGQYYLIQLAGGANGAALPAADATGSINMSATGGKVALVNTTTGLTCNGGSTPCSPAQLAQLVDLVGWGSANFFEGSPAPASSNTLAVVRNDNGCMDTDNNGADFTTAAPLPRNTASPLHACNAPTNPTGQGAAEPASVFPGQTVLLTVKVTPGDFPPSTGLAVSADLSSVGGLNSQIFYDDATNGDGTAGDLIFSFSAPVNGAAIPGMKTISVLISDEQSRSGTASISFMVCPPLIGIHDVQGAGHVSPLASQLVCVQGVATAKRSDGFYIQDMNPDGDEATSEGIFVYSGSVPAVTVGDQLRITGTVKEYRASGVTSAYLTTTELQNPGLTLALLSQNNPLPEPVMIGSGGHIPPAGIIENDSAGDIEQSNIFDPLEDGLDFYESLEGMLVRLNDAVAVGPTKDYGSNRELVVVGDNGAYAGLFGSRGALVIRPDDFNPERLILNDVILGGPTIPSANVADKFPGSIPGVLNYSYGNYKLEPISLPALVPGGLAQEMLNDPAKYELALATFNVENLAPNDPPTKFATLADLIVEHLRSPDLIAIEEIQDNSGAKDDGTVDAALTWNKLLAAIQAAGGPLYEYRQINPVNDQDGGATGGNIRVGFLFRPDHGLSFSDRPGADSLTPNAVVAGADGPKLLYNPGRIDPLNTAFQDSRKPLAAEFRYFEHKLFIIANHFNSKGGDTPLEGRFQPPALSSEVQRMQQAAVVKTFVQSILTLDPAANVVVLGDLNDFQFSNPVLTLKSTPLYDLMETLAEAERYSYVYEGNAQALDHILFSSSLISRPLAYGVVHVNAEFASQASDHDPQAVYVTLNDPPQVVPGGPYIVNEGDTVTVSVTATDPEGGLLTYAWDLDQDGVFETPGQSAAYITKDGPAVQILKVQVTDDGGLSTQAQILVTIKNIAPIIGPITAPNEPIRTHAPVKVSAVFSDPGLLDTHTAVWDWGNGKKTAGVVTEANGAGTVSGSYTYKTPGLYKVSLTLTDKDDGVAQSSYEYLIIYSPDSFATGSGWIDSPAGAYPADPSASGKAWFHFMVKNGKHAQAPQGRAEFEMRSARLHFKAIGFEWLVADRFQARIKGTGTVNGQNSCSFLIEVTRRRHHRPAAFRIKIWQLVDGAEQILYDTKVPLPVLHGTVIIQE
jgi:hypothetical protein